jgi:mono/diheme cytochrome c family protein
MRKFVVRFLFVALGSTAFATAPASFAVAHQGHKMECNETTVNAMNADIQAMPDGEAKATATKEMQMAEQMMTKHDMDGCETHMDKAMEATEK